MGNCPVNYICTHKECKFPRCFQGYFPPFTYKDYEYAVNNYKAYKFCNFRKKHYDFDGPRICDDCIISESDKIYEIDFNWELMGPSSGLSGDFKIDLYNNNLFKKQTCEFNIIKTTNTDDEVNFQYYCKLCNCWVGIIDKKRIIYYSDTLRLRYNYCYECYNQVCMEISSKFNSYEENIPDNAYDIISGRVLAEDS